MFKVGQRWANTAEPELGSGIVVQMEGRMITLFFPEAEATRTYAAAGAPLTRIEYRVGDQVENTEGLALKVTAVVNEDDLFEYELVGTDGENYRFKEAQIVGSSQHSGPFERLLHGQSDRYQSFRLRYETWKHQHNYAKSPYVGLLGPRVDLIQHQFHIANEVSARIAPRVMLADEVGLGKTIEAGLILHRLLAQGRAGRALILVPSPLINQWLVEMMRRFNLNVRIFNEDQCDAICEAEGTDNPFETEQLILCSIEFLLQSEKWQEKALQTDWDMLVVDEAHHLAWSPEAPSPSYQMVERFADQSNGLLLLTATPEKEGHQSHFAQLHLLDPARYHDLAKFVEQQDQFEKVATIAERLMLHENVSAEELDSLRGLLADTSSQTLIDQLAAGNEDNTEANIELAERLLDQQGTGRVLFRNTRDSIPNFPVRHLTAYPLEWPDMLYEEIDRAEPYPESTVTPEEWLTLDTRIEWLVDFLKKNKRFKTLIICHHKETACELERHLTLRGGVLCASFHENLSILERDRAAAWFADEEGGAQALICSEIGSEGRNFQFCHHLILLDLPQPVDLLEQRIGRLDRIGQKNDIQIHVPYFMGTTQEKLFRWYHEGLNAFLQTSAASSVVYSHLIDDYEPLPFDCSNSLDEFIAFTHQRSEELHHQFVHGRNRLLELHSKGDESIIETLHQIDSLESNGDLEELLERMFNQYGVDTEELSDTTFLLRPSNQLEHDHFPMMTEEGFSATYDRDTALARDDAQFLTWDHPMVRGAIDMVLSGERGKACVCLLQNKQLKEGTLLMEALFVVHCPAPKRLQLQSFMPPTPIRLLLDATGRDLSQAVTIEVLDKQMKNVKGELVAAVLKEFRSELGNLIETGKKIANGIFKDIQSTSLQAFRSHMNGEIERLTALQATNPAIKPEEIAALQFNLDEGTRYMNNNAQIMLDGLRVMVTVK